MAITALHSASTGLSALSQQIDVIANNLANVNTTGFKAQRVNFEDLLYEQKTQPGVENGGGNERPAGVSVGLGTRISNTQFDLTTGSPVPTNSDLDLMIDGQGFFQVKLPNDQNGGKGYTRAGNFFVNSNGQVVLGNSCGPLLEPSLTVPQNTTKIQVSSDGKVTAYTADAPEGSEIGQLQLATFVNSAGLRPIGGNLLVETEASGPPIQGEPENGQFGKILQGFLESSNVDPVRELVSLIKTQRAFEMNSKSVQAADQMLQVVSNLTRF